jgi:hypothetical protein
MAFKTQAEWVAAQPTSVGKTPMEYKNALESWQMQSPSYTSPLNYNTFEQYINTANPNYKIGKDVGDDLRNQANFYGMTIENYQNALSGDPTKPMGQYQSVYGNQLLSPIQQIAAQTARAQGIGTMSPEVEALGRANPQAFNAASQKWNDYFKTTFPQTLEYESVLAGPTKYAVTSTTPPKVSDVNSQFLIDPVSKQIIANPNYKPTSTKVSATDVTNIISGANAKSRGLTAVLNTGGNVADYYKYINDWLKLNPNATELERRNLMDTVGITPEDVANATNTNVLDIIARYERAGGTRTGTPTTPTTPISGIDPIVAGQLSQLIPNFAKSKQLASELIASRPTTQSIVNMIQGKAPTASNASLANVMSMIGQ